MTGTEGAQANQTGGFDLLRRATQAMMSRYVWNVDIPFPTVIALLPLHARP